MPKRGRDSELKFFDTAENFLVDLIGRVDVVASPSLVIITQGPDENQRIGRIATIRSIQIRGVFTLPTAVVGGGTVVNMYLMQDKQTNKTVITAGDVMDGTNFSSALQNLNERDRFVELHHWNFQLQAAAGIEGTYQVPLEIIDFYMKCNIPITWDASGAQVTDMTSNNIFLMAGVSNAAADGIVNFTGNVRVRYTD